MDRSNEDKVFCLYSSHSCTCPNCNFIGSKKGENMHHMVEDQIISISFICECCGQEWVEEVREVIRIDLEDLFTE